MKFKLFIDKKREEEVTVYAREKTKLIEAIEQLCADDAFELTGYKARESAKLNLNEIYCFIVEGNKIFAVTAKDKWQLKCRLYNLEEQIHEGFVKINQSCIANIKMIERFDTSVQGTINVRFKNGYTDYVSRRNLKNVKERLGL